MKGILIQKVNSEPGDSTPNGTFGKAVLYMDSLPEAKVQFPDVEKMYIVVWSDKPHLAVATVDTKIDIIDNVPCEFEASSFATILINQYKELLPFKEI